MDLRFDRADFDDLRLLAHLQGHLDEMAPTAPVESRHALDLDGLRAPGVRLWVAHDGPELVATGALAEIEPGHAELKSMRTASPVRGRGVGARILTHLLADGRDRGLVRISLETGSAAFFAPARALYARHGFVVCPPFGSYSHDPHSVFMTVLL